MSLVRVINNDMEFQSHLSSAGPKLVVADFTASWCGPCQRIAPVFESFSVKYPMAVFLKIDVDVCQEVAASQNVSAMPTFILYKRKVMVDRIQGADPNALETKIKQFYDALEGEACDIAGHMDLAPFIMKDQCVVLNETDGGSAKDIINDDGKFVESDCDEQLIFSFTFSQRVKLHSIRIKAPATNGPRKLKLFVNQPANLDFSGGESLKPLQELELTPENLTGKPINLRYVKFQNINTIDIFITSNQSAEDATRVDYIGFIGSPISATNMDDFKRIKGKKGENH